MDNMLIVCNDVIGTEQRLKDKYGLSAEFCDYTEAKEKARKDGYHIMVLYNEHEPTYIDMSRVDDLGLTLLEEMERENKFRMDNDKAMPRYIVLIDDPKNEELVAKALGLGAEVVTESFLGSLSTVFKKSESSEYPKDEEIIDVPYAEVEVVEKGQYPAKPEEEIINLKPQDGEDTKDLTDAMAKLPQGLASEDEDTKEMDAADPESVGESPDKADTRRMKPGEYPKD